MTDPYVSAREAGAVSASSDGGGITIAIAMGQREGDTSDDANPGAGMPAEASA